MTTFEYSSKKLYHFTTFVNAIKILSTNQLKFSPFNNVNDIMESNFQLLSMREKLNNQKDKYSILCFSLDSKNDRIFFNNAIWGYYAEKGDGVCLVLNRKLFDSAYRRLSSSIRTNRRRVRYSNQANGCNFINSDDSNISNDQLFEDSISSLFFDKSSEWEHENEVRYFVKTCPGNCEYIDIAECLEAVIVFQQSEPESESSPRYSAIQKLVKDEMLYRYCFDMNGKLIYNNANELVWPNNQNIKLDF